MAPTHDVNLITAKAGINSLIEALKNAKKLKPQVLAAPDPEVVIATPVKLMLGKYPCAENQVLVTYHPAGDHNNTELKLVSQAKYQAQCAVVMSRMIREKISLWERAFSFLPGKRSKIQEKIAAQPEYLKYKFNRPMYVIDKALYDGPSGVEHVNGNLRIKSSRVIELTKKFLFYNDKINYLVTEAINPAVFAYRETRLGKLNSLDPRCDWISFSDWGIKDECYQLGKFSFFHPDYDKLEKEVTRLSKQLEAELLYDRDQKIPPIPQHETVAPRPDNDKFMKAGRE